MCGGGGSDQTVTQKTELDPAMRRLLYGGTEANPRGGFGSTGAAAAGNSGGGQGGGRGGGNQYNNSDSDSTQYAVDMANRQAQINAEANMGLDPFGGPGPEYAMGGPVMPQQGLASLNQGQMPMMNGQMPNLSDPMTAATLAMAVRSPEMRYGSIMAQQPNPMMSQPMQGYAMGGYIEGPGTGTSDSIPATIYQNGVPVGDAALSTGEFVMTEAAVNGAGGAAKMYEHMRKFENGGTA